MPDSTFQTVSATQVPALWNRSPYETKWMLWRQFTAKRLADNPPDARMAWGKKMQPLLLAQVSEDLRLEVEPNVEYVACPPLGATRDARIIHPERGPGAAETKVCFDYRQWMERWSGGERPPEDIEMQLQIQMCVGDGPGKPYRWGVIAVWLAGEMHYFEREPDTDFWLLAETAAKEFLAAVAGGQEPEPFGDPIEMPEFKARWPAVERKSLILDADTPENTALAETARLYAWAQRERSSFDKMATDLKAKLLAVTKDHDVTALPGGIFIDVKKNKDTPPKTITADMVGKSIGGRAGATSIKISQPEGDGKDPWQKDDATLGA